MEEIFALVYVDYESLYLLELGDKDFIWDRYNKYICKAEAFMAKWNPILEDFLNEPPDEYYDNDFHNYKDLNRFCIMGYRDNQEVSCVCDKFGIKHREPVYY
jgi:hypothetical protein